jgi:adenine-specific DNA-methyltransferase
MYNRYFEQILREAEANPRRGIISENYAPADDRCIKPGERVFFTVKNAASIDNLRRGIESVPPEYQKYFLAPLLYEVSVHNNTGGVFKGFYKDAGGVGKYGGRGENALPRIMGEIQLKPPVFSRFDAESLVFREDANTLIGSLPQTDILYLDPPYNQHPYGSNYFMLNIVAENRIGERLSKVSGIPAGWNRSEYNKKNAALSALEDLISRAKSRYIVLSYNSEGFISLERFTDMLNKYGRVNTHSIKYNTYRASRNLGNRAKHVREYIFVLVRG